MESPAHREIAQSVSHEACVIAEFSTDPVWLAVYLDAVAEDGDADEMRRALRRAAAALRLHLGEPPASAA